MARRDDLIPLEPEEAVRRFREEPETVLLRVGDLVTKFGMTWPELVGELRSGRLVAEGRALPDGGYADLVVRGDALRAWYRDPRTPPELVLRVVRSLEARAPAPRWLN
jgi:hypothetical protein